MSFCPNDNPLDQHFYFPTIHQMTNNRYSESHRMNNMNVRLLRSQWVTPFLCGNSHHLIKRDWTGYN